ncbi:multidrug ABC transporter ATP-binding protein [Pseudonocardia sulfidoxydans NBRC 16205]|uniref:Multidrug ABC transporter ATP-binding protein n=1 Tax=Pseudonocardia sulfidoxydans NBRC 16205 TaxID=1223511 RepID=A0A511DQ25_9PSEU|nr:multidrug ABC transporter ATP-binding protein [Pseudonocardia sulfidoxydans NBRC 16205]
MTGAAVLRAAIVEQRRDVVVSSLLAAGQQAGSALVPVLIGVIVDVAVTSGSPSLLILWIGVLAANFVVLSYSYRFSVRAAERAAEHAEHDLRLRLTHRVLHPGGGAGGGRLSGELVNISTSDAKRVGTANVVVPFGVAAIIAVLVSAVVLLTISVPLGLLVLLGTPPLLLLTHYASKPLERRSEAEQERAAHASGVAADLVAGLRVLKGLGAERTAVQRYRHTSQQSLVATLRTARAYAAQGGVVETSSGVFIAIVALVGGLLAADGAISVGQLVSTVGLALFLQIPLSTTGWTTIEFAQARASAARIAAVLSAPPAVPAGAGVAPEPVRGALRLRGVTQGLLHDVDLDVAPGELLGVVSPSPAIARALLACLAREVDPEQGTVELDDVPLAALDPAAVRAAVLVATHDAVLFAGTLLENVTAAGAEGAADITAALVAAAADEVADSLPDGVDSTIGEQGSSLSGGQRQRVALARALAAGRPVLVLHDPTTAVDSVTESRIAGALRRIRHGRTTVVVTTSPALLAVTDRVVLLDGDGVRCEGRHADLVESHADYRETVLT